MYKRPAGKKEKKEKKRKRKLHYFCSICQEESARACSLTLAKLHVSVLTSFTKLIKFLQNSMKLLPNHIMV